MFVSLPQKMEHHQTRCRPLQSNNTFYNWKWQLDTGPKHILHIWMAFSHLGPVVALPFGLTKWMRKSVSWFETGYSPFAYSHFAYSHFAYFRPKSGISATLKKMIFGDQSDVGVNFHQRECTNRHQNNSGLTVLCSEFSWPLRSNGTFWISE